MDIERDYGQVTGGSGAPSSSDIPSVEELIAGGVITEEPDPAGGTQLYIKAVPLNDDTVAPSNLFSGITAHDNQGNAIVGTYISGREVPSQYDSDSIHNTQVYWATHNPDGSLRSFIQRAFISFSFGGKYIEEFGLIVTSNGFMQRNAYADFSDNVTQSDVWDGQIYWNSHYNNNSIEFTLSTDGMTQRQLDDFKRWFRPGQIKELIVSEHSNRGIHARVSSPPRIEVIPFEDPELVTLGYSIVNGQVVPIQKTAIHDAQGNTRIIPSITTATLYKGSITIEFVMDDPFWYSIGNIVNPEGENYADGEWRTIEDVNTGSQYDDIIRGEMVHCLAIDNYDAWRIIHEDGVPTVDMIPPDALMSFGTKEPLHVDMSKSQYGSLVGYAVVGEVEEGDEGTTIGTGAIDVNQLSIATDSTFIGGRTAYWENPTTGIELRPATISDNDDAEDTIQNDIVAEGKYGCGYMFYAGTAPCRPIITFAIVPQFDDGYICIPYNPIHTMDEYQHKTYNTFVVQGLEKKKFKFTTPSIYTGYNQVIRIFKQFKAGAAWEEVRVALRDNVKHWASRAYALWLVDQLVGNNDYTNTSTLQNCIKQMRNFLDNVPNRQSRATNPDNFTIAPAVFQIDCKTGQVLGTFSYRVPYKGSAVGLLDTAIENVGDMMCSNYLSIEERNYPDENGMIQKWTEDNPYHSLRYYTDCPMTNVYFKYDYMYL